MDVIPYTVEPRADTGVNNVKLGIWLFLASEVMLFGSLFASYILLRTGYADWGHGSEALSVPMATLNTIVLIGSSVTMVLAWASSVERNEKKFKIFQALTVGLGLVFLIVKYFEYTAKFHHGLYPSSSTFMACYFTFTGLHAAHVIAGMGYNTFLLGPGRKMFHTNPEQFTNRVEASGLFWHFVDLVWIFLFPVLYLL